MRKSSKLILLISVVSVGIGLFVLRNIDLDSAKFAIDNNNNVLLSKGNLFLIGIVPFIVVFTMDLIATIEPEQLRPFIRYYDRLKYVICFAFQLLYILIVLGQLININEKYISSFVFIIVVMYIGYTMSHISQNEVFGIKNKWTLGDEQVWIGVHLRAQKLIYGIGIVSLFLTFTNRFVIITVLVALTVITLVYLRFYSYKLGVQKLEKS